LSQKLKEAGLDTVTMTASAKEEYLAALKEQAAKKGASDPNAVTIKDVPDTLKLDF
jgi:hypothetical protein